MMFKTFKVDQGEWDHDLVCKVIPIQTWEPEFIPLNPCKKMSVMMWSCKSSAGEEGKEDSWGPLAMHEL